MRESRWLPDQKKTRHTAIHIEEVSGKEPGAGPEQQESAARTALVLPVIRVFRGLRILMTDNISQGKVPTPAY